MPDPSPENLALVIPTLDAGRHVDRMVTALKAQTLRPSRFLVIDSGSSDDTVARFSDAGAQIHTIPPSEFDHGGTRQLAVDMLPDAEFVIFLTQDAVPAHPEAFANLVRAFDAARAGIAFGRQLPAPGAKPISAHARLFNYPGESYVRSLSDARRYGVKTVFCSNSFAVYRRAALTEAGGFPDRLIIAEDSVTAAAILAAGWTLHYVADARVYHSHDYTLTQEFRRYFDIGVLHAMAGGLVERFGRPEGEGRRFVNSELSYLLRKGPALIPLALVRTVSKYVAYRLGHIERHLPQGLKRRISMNSRYWT
ncbi:MAG: glycosyltransferase family 2 protein [Alphaproteobacteria bacterium]|nr:glycosyltransferase family 2 protein [Alphaproteobacteria bacterium]